MAAVAVIVGLPVLTFLLIVGPLTHQTKLNVTARASVLSVNAAQTARIDRLRSSSAALATLRREVSDLDQALPAKPEIAALLTEIGSISYAKEVSVTSFSTTGAPVSTAPSGAEATPAPATTQAATPEPLAPVAVATPATNSLTSVPIDVQVVGTLSNVRGFIGALQGATRVISVSTVTISEAASGAYTADVAGSAYVLPATSAAGAASAG